MKSMKKGLATLLAVGSLSLLGCNEDEARIGNLSKIPSNVPSTFYRSVRDIDGDGTPDRTIGYNMVFRSVVAISGEPTAEERAEFYRQKSN